MVPQLFLRARKWQSLSPATQALPPVSAPGAPHTPASPGAAAAGGAGGVYASGWQVYAALARMEWESDRSNTALPCKIFELVSGRASGGQPHAARKTSNTEPPAEPAACNASSTQRACVTPQSFDLT